MFLLAVLLLAATLLPRRSTASPAADLQFVDDWCATVGSCVDESNYCAASSGNFPASNIECDSGGNIVSVTYVAHGHAFIPVSVGGLEYLETLYIYVFSSPSPFVVPGEIALLADTLRTLEIVGDGSDMSALPGQLGLLINLESLYISGVSFPPGSAFVDNIGQLSGLRQFGMYDVTYANEFPPLFASHWQSIEYVQLFLVDGIVGALPRFGNKPLLSSYLMIRVEGTGLEFDDPELFYSHNLADFTILNCDSLSGSIPATIYDAPNLSGLSLFSAGNLSFELDARVGQLESLRALEFYATPAVRGELPSELGTLTALSSLIVSGTAVGGEIPSEIGLLTNLNAFVVNEEPALPFDAPTECSVRPDNETVRGHLPQQIVDLFDNNGALLRLDVSRSCLNGEIPPLSRADDAVLPVLGSTFRGVQFGNSLFSGSLPAWLVNLASYTSDIYCSLTGNLFCFNPKPFTVDELACTMDILGPLDECGVCLGDNSTCTDCAGVLHGPARRDLCGVCNGTNDCLDCAGTPNGSSELDACGVCRGDNSTCAVDCAGTLNGTLQLDACGVCGGTGDCLDCSGTPFGTLQLDVCNVCGGTGSSCVDCDGVVGGVKVIDACGVCADVNATDYRPACYDCTGTPNGTAIRDLCGNCPASATCQPQSLALAHVIAQDYSVFAIMTVILFIVGSITLLFSGVCTLFLSH